MMKKAVVAGWIMIIEGGVWRDVTNITWDRNALVNSHDPSLTRLTAVLAIPVGCSLI